MKKQDLITKTLKELMIKGNMDIIEVAFTSDYQAHAGDKTHKGHEFIKRFAQQLRTAIPDIQLEQITFLSETEDTVSWQRSFSGTHKVKMQGIPPSHQKVTWYEMVVSRFENDKIVEEWLCSELGFQLMVKQNK